METATWRMEWHDEEGPDYPAHILIANEEGEEVASIVHRAAFGPAPEWKWQNARLIASAPKLLSALTDLLEEAEPIYEYLARDEDDSDFAGAIERARAAIASIREA